MEWLLIVAASTPCCGSAIGFERFPTEQACKDAGVVAAGKPRHLPGGHYGLLQYGAWQCIETPKRTP
jgi:hypothetical protein